MTNKIQLLTLPFVIYKKQEGVVKSILLVLHIVGKTRLELATTRPPDAYANQLRYFPILLKSIAKLVQIVETTK